ncbi:MAG: hypothetical protein ACLTE2_01260 [Eubacteriales bacterium]
MAANIQAPKGTKDILPKNSGTWQLVEDVMRDEASIHGFEEIRTPVFERTELLSVLLEIQRTLFRKRCILSRTRAIVPSVSARKELQEWYVLCWNMR